MKKLLKYNIVTCLVAFALLAMVLPANAQRGGGGGGGGHSGGGGGGGGHFSGGGGGAAHFSGGGSHFGGSVSRGIAPSRAGYAPVRGSTAYRGGNSAYRGSYSSSRAIGYRGYAGGAGVHGYPAGGHNWYGHGWSGHYRWGRHGGFFYTNGYYGTLYYPWLGFSCGFLDDYYMFEWGDVPYYFDDGLYYTYDNNDYTVVEPPVGALVKELPKDAQSIVINGVQYYEYKGVYYLPVKMDGGAIQYEIAGEDGQLNTESNGTVSVAPKIGDVITKLPDGCRKVSINGNTLYVSQDGIYYKEQTDGGTKTYKIVGIETGDGQQ